MEKSYSAQNKKSTGETTNQPGTAQPALVEYPQELTPEQEFLHAHTRKIYSGLNFPDPGEDITIEFADETDLSLEDIAKAVKALSDTDEPISLDDDDKEQLTLDHKPRDTQDEQEPKSHTEWSDPSFPWPLEKPITDLELSTFNHYLIPFHPQVAEQPAPYYVLWPISEWREHITPLIEVAANIASNIEDEDGDGSDKGLQIAYILQNVLRLFKDFDVLDELAWKTLVHNVKPRG